MQSALSGVLKAVMALRRDMGPGARLKTQGFSHDQSFGGSFKNDDVVGPIVSVKRCPSPRLDGEMSDHVVFPEPSGTENDAFFNPRGRRSLLRFDIHDGSSKFETAVSVYPQRKPPV
jgi:hypothetical protein